MTKLINRKKLGIVPAKHAKIIYKSVSLGNKILSFLGLKAQVVLRGRGNRKFLGENHAKLRQDLPIRLAERVAIYFSLLSTKNPTNFSIM